METPSASAKKIENKMSFIPRELMEPNWRVWSFILVLILGIYLLGLFQIPEVDGLTDPWYSPTVAVIPFVGLFRLTCYAYRKDYHRHLFNHPQACGIPVRNDSMKRTYTGETRFFRIENFHRYFLYIAVAILPFFYYDVYLSVVDPSTAPVLTLGGVILLANSILVTLYTFSCHSVRHIIGGRKDCFACPASNRVKGKGYRFQSLFNEHHEALAWISLAMFFFVDLYIRGVYAHIIPNLVLLG